MLRLPGGSALTPFRRQQLLVRLKEAAPGVSAVAATYQYFVDAKGESPALLQRLVELLPVGTDDLSADGRLLLVVPRLGTLSPWASKATDIARSCGLTDVRCVERGVAYRVAGDLSPDELKRVTASVHDRMTETVLARFEDAARLFR